MSLGDGPEFKLVDLCSEWVWWLESSVLTLEGQEKGLLAKRQKEDFGARRMPFQDFTI